MTDTRSLTLTVFHQYDQATGTRYLATGSDGHMYNDVPRRIKHWTCPAGFEHARYWRSFGNPGQEREHYACEHTARIVRK